MPNNTKIAEGLHLVKLRNYNGSFSCTIAREIADAAGILPGDGFISVRAVGPCIVLARARYVTGDDAPIEADKQFARAVDEWQKAKEETK